MYNTNIILQIQSEYNQLTKTEKKVADYVLKNKKEVLYMSILRIWQMPAMSRYECIQVLQNLETGRVSGF